MLPDLSLEHRLHRNGSLSDPGDLLLQPYTKTSRTMGLNLGFLFPVQGLDPRGLGFLLLALDLDPRSLGRPGSLFL